MIPEPSNEYQKLVEAAKVLIEALAKICPINSRETPDYAELTFGDHQTQAMTMNPGDWEAIQTAYLDASAALSTLKLPHAGDDGWQDIATAPKDGTAFLAYNPMIGVYNTAFTTRWTGDPDETGYEGFPCGFWHLGDSRSYPFGKWDCVPTHWRPLPTPPAKGTPHV